MSRFPFRNKKKIYNLLFKHLGCGPFDGGCIVFARALQIKFGGHIVVLYDKYGAEHAAVELSDGRLIDADGPMEPDRFIDRFSDHEQCPIRGFRPIEDMDLPDTLRDEKLSRSLARILSLVQTT